MTQRYSQLTEWREETNNALFGKKRVDTYDIMRGLLIICVVLGHGSNNTPTQMIIYWFHMPCFVILSGWLYKVERIDFSYILKKAKRLLIPFIIYAFAIDILFYRNSISEALTMILLGAGRYRGGVLWYLPCYFITLIVSGFILEKLRRKPHIILIIALICLSIATIESNLLDGDTLLIPWNLDTALIMVFYFMIGYYLRQVLERKKVNIEWMFLISVAAVLVASVLCYLGLFSYNLDVKVTRYDNIILNVILPVSFYFFLMLVSLILSNIVKIVGRILAYIGRHTITIMFWHIPLNAVLVSRIDYGTVLFVVLGVVIPILFSLILEVIYSYLKRVNEVSVNKQGKTNPLTRGLETVFKLCNQYL